MRITPLLPALVLSGIVPGWISAQSVKESRQDDLSYEKLGPVLDNLPTGSTLKGMRVPVFNKKRERMALLQSGLVKIITRRELTGEKIVLRYFQKDAVIMRINLGAADFSLNTGILRARRAITLGGEQLQGQGSGGIFHLRTRSAVIRGPVSTRFTTTPTEERDDKANGTDRTPPDPSGQNATASTSPTETRAEDNPLATVFTGPEPLTGAELRKINELLQSRSKSVLANRAPTRNFMTQSRQSSNKADTDFLSFAHNVQMPRGKLLARTPPREPAEVTPITMETGEVLVTAGGGMFLNPEQGHISYLREIEVTESRFTMTAAGHLKVFFPPQDLSKAITRPGSDPGEGDELEGGRIAEKGEEESFAELVDPHLLVATGGVRIIYNDPAGRAPPLLATGETAIVDRRSGDIVLQGGTPTIRQGTNSLTAGSPELYLRLYQNGDLYAEEGLWTTVGELTALAPSRPGNGGQEGVGNEETEDAPPDTGKDHGKPEIVKATCRGGLYFDAREGHVVYLKDVEIQHPEFRIQAGDELKVLLRRRPGTESGSPSGPEAFSDVDYVIASGNVRILREDPEGERSPVTATAQHVIFNVETADLILRGGSPSIEQGNNSLRAGHPDLYLRFYQNGSLFAEKGPWTTTGDLSGHRDQEEEGNKDVGIITMTCEGGLSFDSEKGHIVYLGEIDVREPRFRLRCNDSLRITLTEREDAREKRLEGPEAFSDVDRIVALGEVMITRLPQPGAKPVVAMSAAATYRASDGILALRGGYPEIRQGKSFFKARENGLHILFYPNGSFELARGAWEQFFDLKEGNFEKLRRAEAN